MIRRVAVLIVILSACASTPAHAEEGPAVVAPVAMPAGHVVWGDYAESVATVSEPHGRFDAIESRPAVLPVLYASYAALQGYDVYSTRQALARGAREANPALPNVVNRTSSLVALKAGVGAATIISAERLWKSNKAAAITVMIAGNSVAAMVAARNARTLRQLR
jgi:hypothetical protein